MWEALWQLSSSVHLVLYGGCVLTAGAMGLILICGPSHHIYRGRVHADGAMGLKVEPCGSQLHDIRTLTYPECTLSAK